MWFHWRSLWGTSEFVRLAYRAVCEGLHWNMDDSKSCRMTRSVPSTHVCMMTPRWLFLPPPHPSPPTYPPPQLSLSVSSSLSQSLGPHSVMTEFPTTTWDGWLHTQMRVPRPSLASPSKKRGASAINKPSCEGLWWAASQPPEDGSSLAWRTALYRSTCSWLYHSLSIYKVALLSWLYV